MDLFLASTGGHKYYSTSILPFFSYVHLGIAIVFIALWLLYVDLIQKFANSMRKLRRAGKIGEFVSIFVNEKQVSHILSNPSQYTTRTHHPDANDRLLL